MADAPSNDAHSKTSSLVEHPDALDLEPVKCPDGSFKERRYAEVSRQAAVLCALRLGFSISKACDEAGITRRSYYRWIENSSEFARLAKDAEEIGTDTLEDEALRRGRDGWLEPVYHKGFRVDSVRKFSDTLLIMMLNARRPGKFRYSKNGPGEGGNMQESLLGLASAIREAAQVTVTQTTVQIDKQG